VLNANLTENKPYNSDFYNIKFFKYISSENNTVENAVNNYSSFIKIECLRYFQEKVKLQSLY